MRTRPVPDGPADHFFHQEHLVSGELLGDPPGRLRGQTEELGSILRCGAALLERHDPAVEEHAEIVSGDPGVLGEHRLDAREAELTVPATEGVSPAGILAVVADRLPQLMDLAGCCVEQLSAASVARLLRHLATPDLGSLPGFLSGQPYITTDDMTRGVGEGTRRFLHLPHATCRPWPPRQPGIPSPAAGLVSPVVSEGTLRFPRLPNTT